MTKLPTDLSGQELIRILIRLGFAVQRQRGSHIILRRESPFARVSVPNHKTLRVGTLRTILNDRAFGGAIDRAAVMSITVQISRFVSSGLLCENSSDGTP